MILEHRQIFRPVTQKEYPVTNPQIYGQLIPDKGAKNMKQNIKTVSSTNGVERTG